MGILIIVSTHNGLLLINESKAMWKNTSGVGRGKNGSPNLCHDLTQNLKCLRACPETNTNKLCDVIEGRLLDLIFWLPSLPCSYSTLKW